MYIHGPEDEVRCTTQPKKERETKKQSSKGQTYSHGSSEEAVENQLLRGRLLPHQDPELALAAALDKLVDAALAWSARMWCLVSKRRHMAGILLRL